jgi:hypothetical protein
LTACCRILTGTKFKLVNLGKWNKPIELEKGDPERMRGVSPSFRPSVVECAVLEFGSGEEFRVVLANAFVLASWAVLPGLLLGLTWQSFAVRNFRPEFALRNSEAMELDRAVLLYGNVQHRLEKLCCENKRAGGLWLAVFRSRRDARPHSVEELDDLKAHVNHLRRTIVELKHQPLKRLKSWIRILSFRSTWGRSALVHLICIALETVAFYVFQIDGLMTGVSRLTVWYPFDERLFCANAVASGISAVAAPVIFLMRRTFLRREYSLELYALKGLANANLGQLVDYLEHHRGNQGFLREETSGASVEDSRWFSVLGLSQSATIEEVKEAYKELIKQNHPDLVYEMSPAFRELAEAETKKLTAAFKQALQLVGVP